MPRDYAREKTKTDTPLDCAALQGFGCCIADLILLDTAPTASMPQQRLRRDRSHVRAATAADRPGLSCAMLQRRRPPASSERAARHASASSMAALATHCVRCGD